MSEPRYTIDFSRIPPAARGSVYFAIDGPKLRSLVSAYCVPCQWRAAQVLHNDRGDLVWMAYERALEQGRFSAARRAAGAKVTQKLYGYPTLLATEIDDLGAIRVKPDHVLTATCPRHGELWVEGTTVRAAIADALQRLESGKKARTKGIEMRLGTAFVD